MFGIHLGGKHEKVIAVADIGSGSAALAIVAIPKVGPVRILAAERRFLPIEERSPEAIIAALGVHLIEAGKAALASHQKNGGAFPRSAYAIIRAPWTRSKTIKVRTVFPKTARITGAMISRLAQQALTDDTEFDKGRILEASVVRVEVNGYPTAQPEGTLGQELTVATLLSECDPSLRAAVTASLQQLFGTRPLILRSGVHALLSMLRNKPDVPPDFVVVDMASEGTNLMVIRDGVTTDHAMVAEGKNTLLKRVGGTDLPDHTITMLRLLAAGECHDPACEEVSAAMAKAEPELVRVFGETIAKLVARQRLPNYVLLATHNDMVPWLSAFFSRIDFAQFTKTTQPFIVTALKSADLAQWTAPEGPVRADIGTLIATALVNIEQGRAS
ncbi:hypothetical protein A3C18_02750 [Candidatus Kaiserbacteria bacterium RIFCSPHIGHO2_02_FULL_54_11b]|uniref:SHS2 domain-containing protein n=1 Tax=Candidatus Kaiserbacteria bacterium RIFCSPHIGHO2_02_FULL_54_11b TaxID=1798494 RepID=A0A1F6DUB1_9BACT|nr:MAG: hypothetical protein A3C18_02750 [Candidatus Kaiserbacteria bacterium RIFCSPHIGHO2_02_FULL_54_11b]